MVKPTSESDAAASSSSSSSSHTNASSSAASNPPSAVSHGSGVKVESSDVSSAVSPHGGSPSDVFASSSLVGRTSFADLFAPSSSIFQHYRPYDGYMNNRRPAGSPIQSAAYTNPGSMHAMPANHSSISHGSAMNLSLMNPNMQHVPTPMHMHIGMSMDGGMNAGMPLGVHPMATSAMAYASLAQLTPADVVGRVAVLARDQYGCRFLQKKLEEGDVEWRDIVFAEVLPAAVDLMGDPFGNYLCQKVVEWATLQQRRALVRSVASDLVPISLNVHGTRAVQKVVEYLSVSHAGPQASPPTGDSPAAVPVVHVTSNMSPEDAAALEESVAVVTDALRGNVVALIKDLNGNHVIQRCLHFLSSPQKQFIYDAVAASCVEVATHRHGCCVLQRCIDYGTPNQRMQLVHEVVRNGLELVQDPFGNYVLQYVLDMGNAAVNAELMTRFFGHVCDLSINKFSSNVIEKCMVLAPPAVRVQLVSELIDPQRLPQMLQDSFANYVIQTALSVAEHVQFVMLSEAIRPLITAVRNTPYGKKIENRVNKRNSQQHHANNGRSSSHQHGNGPNNVPRHHHHHHHHHLHNHHAHGPRLMHPSGGHDSMKPAMNNMGLNMGMNMNMPPMGMPMSPMMNVAPDAAKPDETAAASGGHDHSVMMQQMYAGMYHPHPHHHPMASVPHGRMYYAPAMQPVYYAMAPPMPPMAMQGAPAAQAPSHEQAFLDARKTS